MDLTCINELLMRSAMLSRSTRLPGRAKNSLSNGAFLSDERLTRPGRGFGQDQVDFPDCLCPDIGGASWFL